MDAKQIGEVVRQARKNKGATKKELRFVPMTVTRYENGVVKKVVPVAEHERLALASAMNLSVISELLYENEEIVFRIVQSYVAHCHISLLLVTGQVRRAGHFSVNIRE